jgi:hypothetical protein
VRRQVLPVLPFLCLLACDPISLISDESFSALVPVGAPVPDIGFVDAGGAPASPWGSEATLVVILANDSSLAGEYLLQVDSSCARLGDDCSRIRRTLILAPTLPGHRVRPGWISLRSNEPERFGEAMGSAWWQIDDAVVGQTLTATVVDRDGIVRARYGGMEMWTELELAETLARVLDPD